ncbi:hypothetical protein, partial [Xylanibacter muris]
ASLKKYISLINKVSFLPLLYEGRTDLRRRKLSFLPVLKDNTLFGSPPVMPQSHDRKSGLKPI